MFERILVLSAAGGAGLGAYACSSSSNGFGENRDASAPGDATSGSSSGSGHADGQAGNPDGSNPGSDASTGDTGTVDAGCNQNVEPDALWSQCCEPSAPYIFDAGADVAPGCDPYRFDFPCGLPSFVQNIFPPACNLYLSDCAKICTGAATPFVNCEVANGYGCDVDAMAYVAADGEAIKIDCNKCSGVGRRPAGLARPRGRRARSALGAYFASAAHLEAASVHAFERLAEELEAHGMESELVRAARRSARDEVRHTRATSRLARRFGGEPPAVRVAKKRTRSLAAVALENAVEGCVRETFGALVATCQARSAGDAEIRRVMARIAVEETRHAALAWEIARALEPRLDDRTRRRIATARTHAIEKLRRDMTTGVSREVAHGAGLPDPERASRMLDELSAAIWS
ncbi:MAG TPA: ferritin-like domain-containing protein [Polyangiaceae bacterium]|nr:ferritin-like domain-containing protein [Polyangiaceae bacterium]